MGSHLVGGAGKTLKIPITIIRPLNIYGPRSTTFVLEISELLKKNGMVHKGFSIEKAQRDLNFAPKVDFEEGMQHVKDWLLQIGYI